MTDLQTLELAIEAVLRQTDRTPPAAQSARTMFILLRQELARRNIEQERKADDPQASG